MRVLLRVVPGVPHCSQAHFSARAQEEAKGMHVRVLHPRCLTGLILALVPGGTQRYLQDLRFRHCSSLGISQAHAGM